MKPNRLIIATRESPLALWQTHWVKKQLEACHPGLIVELLGLTTQADKMLDTPLKDIGGKGLFVKELEDALLNGKADIAVHSMKDVPMELPVGLCLPVMCEREDPFDVLVSSEFSTIDSLPNSARVGTSSLRRQSQLQALRPDLIMMGLRGNVGTRLQKLDKGEYTAIVLAAAGLKRLGLSNRISCYLTAEQSLPAAGQGVLGIECREQDEAIQKLIAPLNHRVTQQCVTAERAMCRRLGGGCHAPIAAYAEMENDQIMLRGLVASPDGVRVLRVKQSGNNAEKLGGQVAEELLRLGARELF